MLLSKQAIDLTKFQKRIIRYGYLQPKNQTKPITLEDKINEFIDWYTQYLVKGKFFGREEYLSIVEMRNFIEKMAIWYELRYPDYEVNRLIDNNKLVYSNESSLINLLDEDLDNSRVDFGKLYDLKIFINSLALKERRLLEQPSYPEVVYWSSNHIGSCLYLSKQGIIINSIGMSLVLPDIYDKDLKGKNINELVQLLREKNIIIPSGSDLQRAISNYEDRVYLKEGLLNCVMYSIIERGGKIIGPRRGFIFAKEFGRNIDIPMIYGIDKSDPKLIEFLNEYIKAGGSRNLICYINYFDRLNKKCQTISIQEVIDSLNNTGGTSYHYNEELKQDEISAVNYSKKDSANKQLSRKRKIPRLISKS